MNVRNTYAYLMAVGALCALTACSTDCGLGDTLAEPQPLVFNATQGELTGSVTRAATDGTWDGTEQVAIQINGGAKCYKVASSGALTPSSSSDTFYRTDKSNLTVTAWYPYSASQPTSPTIVLNQSTKANYESCNLMTATAIAVYGKSTTLTFAHQAARLVLHITDTEGSSVTNATVKFTIGDKEYTAYHETGSDSYSILVAPNTSVTSGADFVSITTTEGTYKGVAPATATFTKGKSYEYNYSLQSEDTTPYLTFKADSEQVFDINISSSFDKKFEYSVGNGKWTAITQSKNTATFGGALGDLRLRGMSEIGTAAVSYGTSTSVTPSTIRFTNANVPVAASGDIRTLIDYKNYSTVNTANARFHSLFLDCTELYSAPDSLRATTLATDCYNQMFKGCTKLKKAPVLPAKTLAKYCYNQMFYGCTNLTKAPELPAETLAVCCYGNMFQDCINLTKAPVLPATTLVTYCYWSMFYGCTKLNEVTIKAETVADGASSLFGSWLYNVASSGTIYCNETFYNSKVKSSVPTGWSRANIPN